MNTAAWEYEPSVSGRQYDVNGVLTNLGRLPAGYDAWDHTFISERPGHSCKLVGRSRPGGRDHLTMS